MAKKCTVPKSEKRQRSMFKLPSDSHIMKIFENIPDNRIWAGLNCFTAIRREKFGVRRVYQTASCLCGCPPRKCPFVMLLCSCYRHCHVLYADVVFLTSHSKAELEQLVQKGDDRLM